jgi:uncharacterized metal-binding protein
MVSKVNRRRFLKSAAVGITAGAAAKAAGSALAAENPPVSAPLPVPDAQTKSAVTGTDPQPVCCGSAAKVIFTCSGSADVGKISDMAARKLTEEGVGKMSCLAGVGGRVSGILASTQAAASILAIDGCPLDCVRKTLEEAGFTRFEHLRLSDIGLEKGKSPTTEERIAQVVEHGTKRLAESGKLP